MWRYVHQDHRVPAKIRIERICNVSRPTGCIRQGLAQLAPQDRQPPRIVLVLGRVSSYLVDRRDEPTLVRWHRRSTPAPRQIAVCIGVIKDDQPGSKRSHYCERDCLFSREVGKDRRQQDRQSNTAIATATYSLPMTRSSSRLRHLQLPAYQRRPRQARGSGHRLTGRQTVRPLHRLIRPPTRLGHDLQSSSPWQGQLFGHLI